MAGSIKGITIEIGGNTTKLQAALSQANKSIKTTQSSLSAVNKALNLDKGNTDLLKDKFDLLQKKVEGAKEKLEALKAAQATMDADGVDRNSEQYKELQQQIHLAEAEVKQCEDAVKEFGSVGAQKVAEVGEKFQEVGGKMQDIGGKLTKGLTVPILAIGAASAVAFNEVDDAMDVIVTKTGASGEALESMKDIAKDMALTIPTSFENAANAVGEVNTRFGLTGDALQELSTQFVQFAEINGVDVSDAVDSAQSAMAAFGVSADDAGNFLDVLNKAGQDTGVSVTDLAAQLTGNAVALQEMGFNASDSAMFIANLSKNGVDASTVMGGLKKALVNATKDGKSTSEAMEELQNAMATAKDKTEAMQIASELFGNKAGASIGAAIYEGKLSLDALGTSIDDFKGNVSSTFDETIDPIDETTMAINSLKATGAELFSTIQTMAIPIIKEVVEKMRALNEWFKTLSPAQQEMIVKIGLVVAAIGPLLSIVGKVVSIVWAITSILPAIGTALTAMTGPIGIVVAAVAAAIAIGVLLYKNWDTICEKATEIKENISAAWGELKENVTARVDEIKEGVSEKWNALKDTVSGVMDSVHAYTGEKLGAIKQAYDEHGGGVQGTVFAMMEGVKQYYSVGYDAINKLTGGKLGECVNAMKAKTDEYREKWENFCENTKAFFSDKLQEMKDGAVEKLENIKETFTSVFDGIKEYLEPVIEWLKGIFDFEWSLPPIKLPHFSISGGFSLNPPSVPTFGVSWYDKGGIFNSPTVIGVGEKRPEFVGALDDLRQLIREENGSNQMVALMSEMVGLLSELNSGLGDTIHRATNGNSLNINKREFARLVNEVN